MVYLSNLSAVNFFKFSIWNFFNRCLLQIAVSPLRFVSGRMGTGDWEKGLTEKEVHFRLHQWASHRVDPFAPLTDGLMSALDLKVVHWCIGLVVNGFSPQMCVSRTELKNVRVKLIKILHGLWATINGLGDSLALKDIAGILWGPIKNRLFSHFELILVPSKRWEWHLDGDRCLRVCGKHGTPSKAWNEFHIDVHAHTHFHASWCEPRGSAVKVWLHFASGNHGIRLALREDAPTAGANKDMYGLDE